MNKEEVEYNMEKIDGWTGEILKYFPDYQNKKINKLYVLGAIDEIEIILEDMKEKLEE